MDLYFHGGLNKAGSTYLQDLFSANVDWLRERGVLYPQPQQSGGHAGAQSGNGGKLALAFGRGDDHTVVTLLTALAAEARTAKCDALLLSYESFYHSIVRDGAVDRFLSIAHRCGLNGFRLLLVFRDPVSHSISAYNHRVGMSVQEPFLDWLETSYEFPREIRAFLANVAGHRSVDLYARAWSPTRLAQVAEEFLGVAGMSVSGLGDANVSINCVEANIVHAVAQVDAQRAKVLRASFKDIRKQDKAPDAPLRRRMEEQARASFREIAPELSAVEELMGEAFAGSQVRTAEPTTVRADERLDHALSSRQIDVLIDVLSSSSSTSFRDHVIAHMRRWPRSIWRRVARAAARRPKPSPG